MPVQVAIDKKEKTLTITMQLQSARASASGKTEVIASTHGCYVTELKRLGRPIVVMANAFVYSSGHGKETNPNKTEISDATQGKIKQEKDGRSKITAVVSPKRSDAERP
jgi:hypothetical protein